MTQPLRLDGASSDLPRAEERYRNVLTLLEHEMRTPLAAALMQLTVVEQVMGAAGSLDRARTMLSGAKRQIAGLSRVMRRTVEIQTQGRVDLQPETCDLALLADDLLRRLKSTNPPLWSRVETRLAEGVVGSWDWSALEQILENLLSNALKFSKDTPVYLTIAAGKTGVRVTVQDRGVGIDLADQQRIFDLFTRAAGTQAVAGQGIGLWIVRHLVQAHGGRIRVRSRKGSGTTFEVWLPRCIKSCRRSAVRARHPAAILPSPA